MSTGFGLPFSCSLTSTNRKVLPVSILRMRPVVVIFGLRKVEFARLIRKSTIEKLPLEIMNGGAICDGSNTAYFAIGVLPKADHVLWNRDHMRMIPGLGKFQPILIHGVSSAMNVLRRLAVRSWNDAA